MIENETGTIFKALVGSHNYNLNTKDSDKDYKYFVLPTFDDLYAGRMVSENHVSEKLDYTVHDIRKLPHLWWKANINFLEVLFSQETNILKLKEPFCSIMLEIEEHSEDIAAMNLPYLYKACRGAAISKYKDMHKDSPGKHASFKKFGYDTKSACHALRLLDFIPRLAGKYGNFRDAIWYDDGSIYGTPDPMRQLLLDVKEGKYSLEEVELKSRDFEKSAVQFEFWFMERKPNTQLKEWLDREIKSMVALGILMR